VAIKGKTKRSQGRPVRRITPGPRPQLVERRPPWYREPAFLVTLAVIAVVVTLVAAVSRVQEAWQRDDVQRFTSRLEAPMSELGAITAAGTADKPGFSSASELLSGKLKPEELSRRAQNWQTELSKVRDQVDTITLGEGELVAEGGVPINEVGGRVRLLTGIKDTYVAGIAVYEEAATALGALAGAAKGKPQQDLLQQSQTLVQRGGSTVDAAAAQLAILRARYDLSVKEQLPGESANAYSARSSSTPQVPGLPPQP
jgi:hypothetical protein